MVKKILNELNDPKINRANVLLGKIQRILCKNNPNGGANPDAKENDDKKAFAIPRRSVKPEQIRQEMANVMDLLEEMKRVVENIDEFSAKNEFREAMAAFEIAREDISDEIQLKINEKNPAEAKPLAANNSFLKVIEGGIDDLSKWA